MDCISIADICLDCTGLQPTPAISGDPKIQALLIARVKYFGMSEASVLMLHLHDQIF